MTQLIALLRKHCLIIIGVVGTFTFAVTRGADFNYDLVNLRGQLAWSIIHGRLGTDSFDSTRYLFPPLNDTWNILLLGTGFSWLPVAFWSAVHALIPISVYLIIREFAPSLKSWQAQLVALTSLTSPLLLMQIGTSFGHLTSSLFLALALLYLLRSRNTHCSKLMVFAGALLGFAVLIRMSNLPSVAAYLFGASFLVASTTDLARFALGFGSVFGGVYFAWTWYASNAAGESFQGFSVVPLGLAGSVVLLALTFLLLLLVSRESGVFQQKTRALIDTVPLSLMRTLIAASVVIVSLRVRQTADQRFVVNSWSEMSGRLVHTGGLNGGCCPIDLEITYWDIRMPMMYLALAAALLLALVCRRRFSSETLGIVIFCCLPVLAYLSFSGYARYASQALILAPIAFLKLIQRANFAPRPRTALVLATVFVLSLPVLRDLSSGSEVPRFAQLTGTSELLSDEELILVNDLIPENATIYIAGDLVSLVAQQLNRSDLIWTWRMPLSSEAISRRSLLALYNPTTPLPLAELAKRGLYAAECDVLRLSNSSIGLCRLTLRSTGLMQARVV